MDYHERIARALEEFENKRLEAEINETLAGICREQDSFLPIFKERELTPEEAQRVRDLAEAYVAQIERYKRLKGWT